MTYIHLTCDLRNNKYVTVVYKCRGKGDKSRGTMWSISHMHFSHWFSHRDKLKLRMFWIILSHTPTTNIINCIRCLICVPNQARLSGSGSFLTSPIFFSICVTRYKKLLVASVKISYIYEKNIVFSLNMRGV